MVKKKKKNETVIDMGGKTRLHYQIVPFPQATSSLWGGGGHSR